MQHAPFPTHSRYTPHAVEAVQTAREITGYEGLSEVGTRHVLWSILSSERSAASRLLHQIGAPVEAIREACRVQRYGAPGNRAGAFVDAMTLVGIEARSTASALGDGCVGTAHLLLGLFTDPEIAELLRKHGVTRDRVGGELLAMNRILDRDAASTDEELPGARPSRSALTPTVLTTIGIWTAFQVIVALLEVQLSVFWQPLLLVEMALRIGISLLLIGPLFRRRIYAWAAITALLFVQCAFWCAASLYLLLKVLEGSARAHSPEMLSILVVPYVLLLLFDGILFAVTRGLFGARWWFGIGERDGWTVLKRDGGWVLLVMGAIYLFGLVMGSARFSGLLVYQ